MTILGPFILSLSLTLWLSFLLLRIGKNWLIDLPAERKIHNKPIPRIGGLAIGGVYFLGLGIVGLGPSLWWYLAGGVILFFLGGADDYKSIRWPVKLLFQLAVSSIVIAQFLGEVTSVSFFSATLNFSTLGLIAVFLIWFVGILNAVNLIDGMDGLAGGFMVLITVFSMIIGAVTDANLFLILNTLLLGTLVGFLLFNRKPARYFMGDLGSLILGYHVACLPLLYHQLQGEGALLQITPFLILSSFLIMDTTRVFFRRLLRGQNPMNADTIHLHHLVFKETNSYMGTLIPIFSMTLITGIGAVLFFLYGFGYLAMQIFLLILVVFVLTPPVPFYVPLTSRLIRNIARFKTSRFSNKHLFRVRYLPFFGFVYLLLLGIQNARSISFTSLPAELLVGSGLLLFFAILGRQQDESFQAGLILTVLAQLFLFLGSEGTGSFSYLYYGRIGCLAVMVTIAAANYVENSRHLGFDFWSVIDLLVLLLFAGLVVLWLNGLEISLWKWTEVILYYYSLGLYTQHRHSRISVKFLRDVGAR